MKKKYLLILLTLILSLSLVACASDNETPDKEEDRVEEANKEEPKKEEPVDAEEEELEDEPEEDLSAYDDMKGEIIGKSDKDFTDVTDTKPSDVRNDSTGNWKKLVISEPIKIEEYALSYKNEIMNDKEIHFIVNFNNNTTTTISDGGGLLYVTIKEYVKKEEHDAKVLGSGMVLADYIIYPDGDIERVED